MRFAYADPPYLGNGRKKYAPFHEDADQYDKVESHVALCKQLVDEFPDGFAISCNPKDLRFYLPALPDDCRIAAWTKSFHQIRVNVSTQYAWEPVIWRGGRQIVPRKPMVRDWITCPIAMRKGLPGAKPDAFNAWVLELLGWQPGDELVELFPGTQGLTTLAHHLDN